MSNQAVYENGQPTPIIIRDYIAGIGTVYSFDLVDDDNSGFTLDVGYTLEIAGQTFTIGNGLETSINTSGKFPVYTFAWAIAEGQINEVGVFEGYLCSDSRSHPTFFQMIITLEVNESIC